MRVIISNILEDKYKGYKVVHSFREVRDCSNIQCLIIHKYSEPDFDSGVFISEFKKNNISNFIYISEDPSTTMKMVLSGVNGVYISDEFYFDDEEELDILLDEIGVEKSDEVSLVSNSLSIISDFIKAFARDEDRIKAPIYLEQVNTAIKEVCENSQQQELQIKDMGTSAVEIFEKASNIITNIDKQRKVLEQQLKELEDNQKLQSSSPRNKVAGGVAFFPTYKYTGSAKVLLVRELSPCRYLTSFMLAYTHHVHYELHKRVKLIFVHQKGAGVSLKYNFCTSISQESILDDSLYDASIIATNNPKSDVMKELTHKNDEVIIVIDRLYGRQDIIDTRVSKVCAVSGLSDLERFKVKPKDCIFTTTSHPQGLICIPHIKSYATDSETRFAMYNRTCKENFMALDSILQLG